jgi:hypothetical protein
MTREPSVADPALASPDTSAARRSQLRGALLAGVILCVYGALALSVDFPRAAIGIQSDEATYYMMGHSLAQDGDLTYRKQDLVRVWREFTSGPTGLFLKKGRDIVRAGLMRRPPFVWIETRPDPDPTRLFFGKSFIYPLAAAPFVSVFGTNGFLVLNAVLLAAIAWCGYLFLAARMRPLAAALLAGAFLMASVAPVYFVWIAPELFNLTLSVVAYFCWLYKEAAPRDRPRNGWLYGTRSDLAAAMVLGIATFSKVSNALLFPPIVAWQVWQRRPRAAVLTSIAFVCVAGGLFAVNTAITGEWNYQGGERNTYYYEFPFQTPESGFDAGQSKSRSETLTEIIFDPKVFWTNLSHNLAYFFVGRYAGLVAYFFPAVFALAFYLVSAGRRPAWQHLVCAAGLVQMLFFVIVTPYTWDGGGGSVGNRYFMGAYGLFLFLMPVISRPWIALVPWAVGSLFMAPLVLNPFVASFYPGRNAAHGPLRLLPVELTLVYDWPINTDKSRVMQWFGDLGQGDPGFQIYFFDENAYGREEDKSFWVRGGSRAEFLIKEAPERTMKRLVLTLSAGPVPTQVLASVGGRSQSVNLPAGASQQVFFGLDRAFRYQGVWRVWHASVSSSDGFVPVFVEAGSTDTRYLGVRVRPMLVE